MIGIRSGRKSGETPLLIRACASFGVGVDNFFRERDFRTDFNKCKGDFMKTKNRFQAI
jgi:hypothetical protein